MLSPDTLAAAVAPPPTSDADLYAAQLRIADAALTTAEQLLATVPPGRHREAALQHVVRAARVAYAGMVPALVPAGPDEPIPYTLTGATAGDRIELPIPGTAAWRYGVQNSPTLHPLSRLVGLVLADQAGPSGYIPPGAQPTLHQLATRTGLPLPVLHTHLQELVAQRWVTRRRAEEHGATTRYQLRMPDSRKDR